MSRIFKTAFVSHRIASKGWFQLFIFSAIPATFASQPVRLSTNLKYRHAAPGAEPDAELWGRFLDGFNKPDIDGWWVRTHMQNLHNEDVVPEPEVAKAALKACRKINDLALAIRFLECVRIKCSIDSKLWPWFMQEISPTLKELGIPSLEELGYDKPELALVDYDE